MAGPTTVWGIDVGKNALKALKLRIGADKSVEAVAADYIEHAKIMSQPEADRDALWAAALEKFLSRNDISNDKVVVGVPGQQTLSRFSKLPPLESKKKIPDIVRYEADQQIPFDMDEVVWDYQTFQAPESPEIEVGIFAIKRDLIREHLQYFQMVDIEPLAVQASPLAIYNALHYDGVLGDKHVVVVDIGTDNTDLLVATEHGLWTRTIRVGGNNFTEALVKSFKLSFSKAETLKRTAATSKYARQIFQAMRPVFVDLVQELQRSIGFYTATHREAELSKVLGIGAAFQLPGLQKYLQQNLQLNVDWLEKFSKIKVPSTEGGHPATFVGPYGLALQGLSQAEINSNLLPPEIATQVVWRKKRPFFAAAAACLVLAGGVVWFRKTSDNSTLEAAQGQDTVHVGSVDEADRIINSPPTNAPPLEYAKTIVAAAKAYQNESRQLSSQGADEQRKTESIGKLLQNRAVWLKLFNAVHQALPEAPEALANAKGATEYQEAVKSLGMSREERPEIFIESFDAKYFPDLSGEQIPDEWAVGAGLKEVEGQPKPGFILTIKGKTTRASSGLFVKDTFISKLLETARQPGQGFYINRVGLSSTEADKEQPANTNTGGRGDRGRGFGDNRRPTVRPQVSESKEETDPLTGEPISSDWSFKVTAEVVMQDMPVKPEAGQ